GGDTAVEKYRSAQHAPSKQYGFTLTGREFSYRAVVDQAYPGRLIIVSILELPPSLLEAQRDRSLPLTADFLLEEPLHPKACEETLQQLSIDVERHDQEQRIAREEAADRRLFDLWREILDVKDKLEHRLEAP